MFTHALVQQALYDELTLARKQRLHLRAADAIETVHAADIEAHVPILAVHLRAAGAAADPARVIDASVRATRATWRVFAYEDAMAHAEAALELMEEHGGEPPERARLLERLGDLHFVAGIDYERGLDHLDNALHLFESLGVVPRATRVHLKLGRSLSMFWQVMDIPRARQHLLHAERVIGSSTDPEAAGRLAAALGLAALQAMDQELLADCAARCMELGRQIPNDALWATGASLQGHLQCCEGRFDEGLLLLEEAWAAADRIGHVAAAFGATWIAGGWAGIRDAAEGHRIVQRELDKPRQAKASHTRDTLVSIAATDLVLAGRLDDARRLYADVDRRPLEVFAGGGHEAYLLAPAEAERSIRAWAGRFTDSGNNLGRQSAARLLGDVFADIGDCDGARRSLDEAIELTGGQLPSGELYCRPQLAVIHVRDGRIAMARDQLGRCRELAARGCGTTNHNALYLLAAGVLAIAEGSSADGDRACAEALAIQVGASHRWYAARTLREWGRALIASGDRQGGADRLDQALEAYESMGIESAWTHSLVAERRRLETS